MATDYTKFALSGIEDPHAATLLAAITAPPVANGYVLITLKTGRGIKFAPIVRALAAELRAEAARDGLTDITAYREARADELGGAVPYDQGIFGRVLEDARRRHAADPERWKSVGLALQLTLANDIADWIVLAKFATTEQAAAAAARWKNGDAGYAALTRDVTASSINAFENGMRYAYVSRDPNLVQFFNLFPGPGDREVSGPDDGKRRPTSSRLAKSVRRSHCWPSIAARSSCSSTTRTSTR